MEKFSGWTDEATGVNPFVQPSRRLPASAGKRAVKLGLKLVLCAIRIPCLCILAILLLIPTAITAVVPFPWLERLLRFVFEASVTRVMMTMFGFYAPKEATLPRTLVEVEPSTTLKTQAAARGGKTPPMDVILVNQQSYIDILYLATKYTPTFARVSQQGGLTRISTLSALLQCFGTVPEAAAGDAEESTLHTLEWARSTFAGPLVVFPEGAPTNGRGVLTFTQSAADLAKVIMRGAAQNCAVVKLLAITYPSKPDIQVPYISGSPWEHAMHLMGTLVNNTTTVELAAGLDPQPLDCMPALEEGAAPTQAQVQQAAAEWSTLAQHTLANMVRGGCRPVPLTAADHVSFLKFAAGDKSAQRRKRKVQ